MRQTSVGVVLFPLCIIIPLSFLFCHHDPPHFAVGITAWAFFFFWYVNFYEVKKRMMKKKETTVGLAECWKKIAREKSSEWKELKEVKKRERKRWAGSTRELPGHGWDSRLGENLDRACPAFTIYILYNPSWFLPFTIFFRLTWAFFFSFGKVRFSFYLIFIFLSLLEGIRYILPCYFGWDSMECRAYSFIWPH